MNYSKYIHCLFRYLLIVIPCCKQQDKIPAEFAVKIYHFEKERCMSQEPDLKHILDEKTICSLIDTFLSPSLKLEEELSYLNVYYKTTLFDSVCAISFACEKLKSAEINNEFVEYELEAVNDTVANKIAYIMSAQIINNEPRKISSHQYIYLKKNRIINIFCDYMYMKHSFIIKLREFVSSSGYRLIREGEN